MSNEVETTDELITDILTPEIPVQGATIKDTEEHKLTQGTHIGRNKAIIPGHIAKVAPSDFIEYMVTWVPEIINGHSAGLPPITFRYLTKSNEFVMIAAEDDGKGGTRISLAGYNTGKFTHVIEEVSEAYIQAAVIEKEHKERKLKVQREHAKKMKKSVEDNKKIIEDKKKNADRG